MERKIGEIFEYNNEWYQTSESGNCECCGFQNTKCDGIRNVRGECVRSCRSDRKPVIFKKLEKVGESITVKGRTFQKLTSDNNSCKECVFNVPNKACCKNSYTEGICGDNGFWVEIKQTKEDMEEQKIRHYDCFFDEKQPNGNLKPFDLEAAKAGKPVCTRDGRKARIVCFDRIGVYPIIALVQKRGIELCHFYTEAGQCVEETNLDLMMDLESEEIYDTKEDALRND